MVVWLLDKDSVVIHSFLTNTGQGHNYFRANSRHSVIITSADRWVIIVCIAGVPRGPNCVETPICCAQDIFLGRVSLPGRAASAHTRLILLHWSKEKTCDLPKVVTREVLDGAVNRSKDRLVTQTRWRQQIWSADVLVLSQGRKCSKCAEQAMLNGVVELSTPLVKKADWSWEA